MSDRRSARISIVEDVPIPKHLLATAKFESPWEQVKWEKSLPHNDRVQDHLSATPGQRNPSGLGRSASLSAVRITRPLPLRAPRPLSNPPALQGMNLSQGIGLFTI